MCHKNFIHYMNKHKNSRDITIYCQNKKKIRFLLSILKYR